jgi:hypothetical protein
MKKHLWYIIFCLIGVLPLSDLQAQVAIGRINGVDTGAALELVSNTAGKGGMLLPKVVLPDARVWAPVEGITTDEIEGMVVYNTNNTTANNLKGIGAYVWIENRWIPFVAKNCATPPTPASLAAITILTTSIKSKEAFVASIDPVPGATSYEWELTTLSGGGTLIGNSNTNFISLIGITAGTYKIRVQAKNACGASALIEKDITVTNPVECPLAYAFIIKDAAYTPNAFVHPELDRADGPTAASNNNFPGWEAKYKAIFGDPIGDLCVYKKDVSSGGGTWSDQLCYPNGWQDGLTPDHTLRMPNIMELGKHMRATTCSDCSTYGLRPSGTHRFFSSTLYITSPSTTFIGSVSTSPTDIGIQTFTRDPLTDTNVRCVKTIPY